MTPQNYISPMNKISNLSNLSKSHSKPSMKFSRKNTHKKYINHTKSTKVDFRPTPENFFPFSLFNEQQKGKENQYEKVYLEKRNDAQSIGYDFTNKFIRSSNKKKDFKKINTKKIKGMKLLF